MSLLGLPAQVFQEIDYAYDDEVDYDSVKGGLYRSDLGGPASCAHGTGQIGLRSIHSNLPRLHPFRLGQR